MASPSSTNQVYRPSRAITNHSLGRTLAVLAANVPVTTSISTQSKRSSTTTEGTQNPSSLSMGAHRRWNAAKAVQFLRSIDKVDILNTQENGGVTYFTLEICIKPTAPLLPSDQADQKGAPSSSEQGVAPISYTVQRHFSDFERLRQSVYDGISVLPQCACEYCTAFLLYIRFDSKQPCGLVKLVGSTSKRKQALAAFLNEFIRMGERRVSVKAGKRECSAQEVVPGLLESFLQD